MIRPYHLLCVFLLTPLLHDRALSQSTEGWRIFSALDQTNAVASGSDGGVLVGTNGGAYRIDNQGEIAQIWKSNGELLELDVTAIGEDPGSGDVYFGSANGSVSILRHGGWWTYVGDLARSGKPDRQITGFVFRGEEVYILSSFGVSLFSLSDSSLRDSWTRLGSIPADSKANDVAIVGDSLFVATESGLAIAPRSGRDLADPLSWRVIGTDEPCGPAISSLEVDGIDLYVATPSGICRYSDGLLSSIPETPGGAILSGWGARGLLAASGDRLFRIYDGGSVEDLGSTGIEITGLAPMGAQRVAVGLVREGVALMENRELEFVLPDGPVSNAFLDMVVTDGGDLWVASGDKGVSRLRDENWMNFRRETTPALTSNSIRNVSIDHTGRVWGGSFGDGFFRFSDEGSSIVITRFDETNTPLQDVNIVERGVTVTENVASDEAGTVWGLNWDNTDGRRNALYSFRYTSENGQGEWQAHPFSGKFFSYTKTFRWIAVDFNGTKWIGGVDKAQGLLYYVDEEGVDMAGEWNSLTLSNGLPSNAQTALLVDPDGELWIGTPNGVTILVNPWSVRQDGPSAAVFRDVPTLDGIYIWDIAVDALNRKWVASDRGAFVLSSDGTELIARYTVENSPLTRNEVLSVAVDDRQGYVYLGTRNGLNRVTTAAVRSTESDQIIAHPQPFRQGIDVELRLEGLPTAAIVKILTIDGRVVAEFPSPGGAIAFWDGLDQEGNPVASGIYLVVAESREGESISGKVAIIHP